MSNANELPHRGHMKSRPVTRFWWRAVLVLAAGIMIARVDSSPGWDDTGVTVFAILVAVALGSVLGLVPWLSATLVTLPLLVAELSGGLDVLIAVPIALFGAYSVGFFLRQAFRR